MTRCIEQESCYISNMNPDENIEYNDWYMKTDPAVWIAYDSECLNIPVDDPQCKTVFTHKPTGVG